eukprot:COSAG06_NODE_2048_length_7743_cov_19.099163_2_plen_80_part_00
MALGRGRLAPIQPQSVLLKPTVGTQSAAHPHHPLFTPSSSVNARFALADLDGDAEPSRGYLDRWRVPSFSKITVTKTLF